MHSTQQRILSLLITLLMVFSMLPVVSHATDGSLDLRIASVSGAPGESISVPLTLSNNPGISSLKFDIHFDDTNLTLTNVTFADGFGSYVTAPTPYKNPQTISLVSPLDEISTNGLLATLTFTISESAVDGETLEITATYDEDNVFDSDFNNIPLNVTNGSVMVMTMLPGDINGDGAVNNKDAIVLFRYLAGWGVTLATDFVDINGDGKLNNKDAIVLFRYIADPENTTISPSRLCSHQLEAVSAIPATCTEAGNIAYWHCTICGNCFKDANATQSVTLENTVVSALGHDPVIIPAIDQVGNELGYSEGSKCARCGLILVAPQPIYPPASTEHYITYDIANGDTYLLNLVAQGALVNPNESIYQEGTSYTLLDPTVDGYIFLGWYDGAGSNATLVREIPSTATEDIRLYAHWETITYHVTYKLYQTPLGAITDQRFLTYTVNRGLADLPNPTIYNYVFLGWYYENQVTDPDGQPHVKSTEMTNIPVGTVGDITLNAFWTSKRNMAKKVNRLADPVICHDSENGVIYFMYELGTIENIPLTDAIWTIQSVAGLAQQTSVTVTKSTSTENASQVVNAISKETVDSGTWTLSADWNDTTHVNEAWANEHGMTQEEAETQCRTEANTFCVTSSNGGSSSQTTTDGTTTQTYDSKNTETETGSQFDVSVNGKYSNTTEVSAGVKFPVKIVDVNAGIKNTSTFEIGGSVGYGNYDKHKTNVHSGTDTTSVHSTVSGSTSSWSNSSSASRTQEASQSRTVAKAMSEVISQEKQYGSSHSYGGSGSQTQGLSNTSSESMNSSCMLSYSTSEIVATTTTYSTDGKSEGCYRLVIAGTAHVFGVVGYDVASRSYFTYTYNVMDDRTYQFLDYSPDLNFNDCEYSVLPFEIPGYVRDYVNGATAYTAGLEFETDSTNGTATVSGFEGTETDIIIPTYLCSGNASYKVTSISNEAFSGKNIEAVHLGDYIDEIPDSAFKNCTALKEVTGYFTKIGNEAFSGCTAMEHFNISSNVSNIGTNAFLNVPSVTVNVLSEDAAIIEAYNAHPEHDIYAETEEEQEQAEEALKQYLPELTQALVHSAINSGAKELVLDISEIADGIVLSMDVPVMDSFELKGGNRTFTDLKLKSQAEETILTEVKINDCTGIPLQIASPSVTLNTVHVSGPTFILLLSADSANLTLKKDSRMVSAIDKTIVCKDPTLTSVSVDSVTGKLYSTGNVYCCGTVTGQNYLKFVRGQLIPITESEFNNLCKGAFTVSFNATGGTPTPEPIEMCYGEAYGDRLPSNVAKQYYTFDGWYTAETGGEKVEASTIFENTQDIVLYAHWTLNSFIVSFNANGGSVGTTTLRAYCGQALGTLPTPTRDYYTFTGWFTAASGGTQVTAETVYSVANNITVYAHWTQNPVLGWIRANELPAGAQVVDQKWTYTKTTTVESRETSMSGYTLISSRWVQSGTGSSNYSTAFPSGFDTSHWIYTSFRKSAYTASETETSKRTVSDAWGGYVYWHWMYDTSNASGTSTRAIYNKKGSGPDNGFYYKYFGAFTSTEGNYSNDTYYCNSLGIRNYIIPGRTAWADCQGATRWFRFDFRVSTYTDYYKLFTYQKVENLESSTEVTPSDTISNVQKWVKYRNK